MTKFCFPRCPSILLVVRRVVNSNHHFLALSPAPLNDPTFPVAVRQTPLLFMISTLLPDDYFSKLDIILEKKVFLTFCPHLYTFYSSQRRGHRHWDLRVAPDSLLLGHCYRHFAIFALRVFQGNEDTVVVKNKKTLPFYPFIQVVQEYERAVIFRLGRLLDGGSKGPGKSSLLLGYLAIVNNPK